MYVSAAMSAKNHYSAFTNSVLDIESGSSWYT
jgi:hypothetical protein